MFHIVLMGIQGSGKGTQAALLHKKLGVTHINVGNIFRQHMHDDTEYGKVFREFIDAGHFVPDEYVLKIVEYELKKIRSGFCLDGFPRNVQQADYLLHHHRIDKVFLFELEHDGTAIERMLARRICRQCQADYNLLNKRPQKDNICDLCGGELIRRSDDALETIRNRFAQYYNLTRPVIDYFEEKDMLCRIKAEDDVLTIHRDVLTALGADKSISRSDPVGIIAKA